MGKSLFDDLAMVKGSGPHPIDFSAHDSDMLLLPVLRPLSVSSVHTDSHVGSKLLWLFVVYIPGKSSGDFISFLRDRGSTKTSL